MGFNKENDIWLKNNIPRIRLLLRTSLRRDLLPGVKHIIAVSSGKGGVGKSTVTVNMAVALKKEGYAVGIMDADIYGPNIPMMIGVTKEPIKEGDKITPAEGQGVKVISMGFFVPEDTPVVWRGPMVHGAIQQFFRDVVWGELDYLLIDLPPGTGDVPLTLSQLVPLTGAITVTTPQEVALSDVRKGMTMFKKVNVPLLGVVENMSYFVCGHCGERTRDFFPLAEANRLPKNSTSRFLAAFLSTRLFGRVAIREVRSWSKIQILPKHRHFSRLCGRL